MADSTNTENATEDAVALAEAENVDISTLAGSGSGGKVVKSDVQSVVKARAEQEAAAQAAADADPVFPREVCISNAYEMVNEPPHVVAGALQGLEGDSFSPAQVKAAIKAEAKRVIE